MAEKLNPRQVVTFAVWLLKLQREAREARRGLWESP